MDFEGLSESEINEIVEYGIWRWKIITVFGSVAVIFSGLMGILTQGILFCICLCALRRYAGGYHADTQNRCFVISFIVLVLSLLWIKNTDNISIVGIVVQSVMLLILILLAPVENKNHTLDKREIQKYGKRTRITALILYSIYMLLYVLGKPTYAISIEATFAVVVISLVIGSIKNIIKPVNHCEIA